MYKNICRILNYIEHFVIFVCTITEYVSVSGFACLVGIPIGITSSAVRSKICVITAGIKMNKLIIKKKKNIIK